MREREGWGGNKVLFQRTLIITRHCKLQTYVQKFISATVLKSNQSVTHSIKNKNLLEKRNLRCNQFSYYYYLTSISKLHRHITITLLINTKQ